MTSLRLGPMTQSVQRDVERRSRTHVNLSVQGPTPIFLRDGLEGPGVLPFADEVGILARGRLTLEASPLDVVMRLRPLAGRLQVEDDVTDRPAALGHLAGNIHLV